MLGTMGVAQAATKATNVVDREPGLCEHFRKALVADRVASMTRHQLCQYSFEQKHGGQGYFEKLDWQPVPGDPVALTLKIYDANVLPPNIQAPDKVAKKRTLVAKYAEAQRKHHALVVEMAPYTWTQLTWGATFTQVRGYVLRSRGTYCGTGRDETTNKRNVLIAFFEDKELTKSLPYWGSLIDNVDEPMRIHGKYYVVSIMDAAMWSDLNLPGVGDSYILNIDEPLQSNDDSQLGPTGVCQFTYLREAK
ncbi:hypothetical protein BV497_07375 [Fulvimonas soli]|nr:hypothetical protein BV497_07375 [Fulvimonas soli]